MKNKALDEIVSSLSVDERLKLALSGFFVISVDRSVVYCPGGRELRRKSIKKRGDVRYCTKSGCAACSSPCFQRSAGKRFREIDFSSKTFVKGDEEKLKEALGSLC